MDYVVPCIPEGWRALGHLPPFDIKHTLDQDVTLMSMFTQDLLQLVDPLGMYSIDVGFFAEGVALGTYGCRLTRGTELVMEANVATLAGVRMWLDETIRFVQRKTAQ